MIMGGGVDITVHLRTIETQLSGQKTTIALLNQRYARNFHYWQQNFIYYYFFHFLVCLLSIGFLFYEFICNTRLQITVNYLIAYHLVLYHTGIF